MDHLKRSNPKSKKLIDLENELKEITKSHDKELETFIDYKRFILKEAFYLRFNALSEYAEKSALIANFGKYLIDLIDIETTQQKETSDVILMDALLTIDGWEPLNQRHTLTEEQDLVFQEDDDATLLTDQDVKKKKQELHDSQYNEKTSTTDYYYQLYNEKPKRAFSSHRSYAEFQLQLKEDSPPAYTNENNNTSASDSKKSK
jgi:hypothetical protein